MPDLGKAVYSLVLNTTAYTGPFKEAEAQAMKSTRIIGESVGAASEQMTLFGTEAGVMGTKVTMGYAEAGAGAKAGAAEVETAAAGVAAASAKAGTASKEAAGGAGAAWAKFGRVGRQGMGVGMIGLAALYLTVKGGIDTLSANTKSMAQMNNVIKSTGGIAGVTAQHAQELGKKWEDTAGSARALTQQMLSVLLGFTNIRNEAGKGNQIYDRTVQAIENISTRTGKGLQQVSVAVGKAIQDPGKYMTALARTGVTFTKTQIDMAKSLIAANRPLDAQKYVLAALEKRYGAAKGAAWAYGQTAAGQFAIAKNKLGEASAQILTAFIPAFMAATHALVSVTKLLGQHAEVVKLVALAYIGLKLAAIGYREAMAGWKLLQWTAGLFRVKVATEAAKVETEQLTLAVEAETVAQDGAAVSSGGLLTKLGLMSVGFGPVVIAALAAAAALLYFRHQVQAAQDAQAAAIQLHGGGTELQQSERMYYNRKVSNYRAAGKTQKEASALATADTQSQFKDKKFNHTSGGTATADKLDNSTFTNPAAKAQKGQGLLPLQMQIDEAKSQREGSKAQIAVLDREQTYLTNLLAKTTNKTKQLAIQQQLSSIYSSLQGFKTAATRKAGVYTGIIPSGLAIAYQKALQTKSLNDDIKNLKQQETYLKDYLKNTKLSAAKQLAAMKELTAVKKKLASDLTAQKKAQDAAQQAFNQQMQAFVDTRGSFFSQFASSVFHAGPGGLQMGGLSVSGGGGGNTSTVNQHNTFHEIPKNRFELARQMASASAVSA